MTDPLIGLSRPPRDLVRLLHAASATLADAGGALNALVRDGGSPRLDDLNTSVRDARRLAHELRGALRDARLSATERGSLAALAERFVAAVNALEQAGRAATVCECGDDALTAASTALVSAARTVEAAVVADLDRA